MPTIHLHSHRPGIQSQAYVLFVTSRRTIRPSAYLTRTSAYATVDSRRMDSRATENLVLLWKTRLEDARLRYDFARNYVEELQKQSGNKTALPGKRRIFLEKLQKTETYQTALQGENLALDYYQYVLSVFTALTLDRRNPTETWGCR